MERYSELSALMERVIHKYNQLENMKRTYGTDTLLSRAEIHTIVAVGDHPGLNITTLAQTLGITKGAASQMIYKLVDKGAVEKLTSPVSDTEVILNLTEKGKVSYISHREYHDQANDEPMRLLRDMPEETFEYIMDFLSAFEQTFDKKLREK